MGPQEAPEPLNAPEPKSIAERETGRGSLVKWAVISLILVVALAGIGLGSYIYVHNLQESELREALVTNCEKSGNTIREVLQRRVEREIEQTENMALLEKFLPQVPTADLEALQAESLERLHGEMREVAPVNCQKKYPH